MLLANILSFGYRVFGIALGCLWLIGCGTVKDLAIPPQQEFVIGGGNNRIFTLKINNRGETAARLSETLEYGEKIDLGFLPGGDRRKLTFLSGSTARLTNVSSDTVYLKLRIVSPTELENRVEVIQ